MDLGLESITPTGRRTTKPAFLTQAEWQQIDKARETLSFRQIWLAVRDKMKAAGRPFFTSRDVFCRSYYLWKHGETE